MGSEIRFYRATGEHGFLSNLWPCFVVVDGVEFRSSEHAYQWAKPNKDSIKEWIRVAPYPRLAAIAAHGLFPYDIVEKWNETKVDRMRVCLAAKFGQNPDLLDKLLRTWDAEIIEESPTDAFWGLGKKGIELNTLGKMLMELRSQLREAIR